jgi:hypothetical protein
LNPEGEALNDASGEPVRYEVAVNRQAYDYIVQHQLWNPQALEKYLRENKRIRFPRGNWGTRDSVGVQRQVRGAIIAKMAWKVLDPKRDDFASFHKSWAYITPVFKDGALSHSCEIKPVGLIGLHLAFKLASVDEEGAWATYEHQRVAPLWSEVGRSDAGYGGEGNLGTSESTPWLFYSANAPGRATLNQPTGGGAKGTPEARVPSRIVRNHPPGYYFPPVSEKLLGQNPQPDCSRDTMEFACLNQNLASGFNGSVMSHYLLVGTQWPVVVARTQSESATKPVQMPEVLANATLESFNQPTSSCIGCHEKARLKDSGASLDFAFFFRRHVLEQNRSKPLTVDPDH